MTTREYSTIWFNIRPFTVTVHYDDDGGNGKDNDGTATTMVEVRNNTTKQVDMYTNVRRVFVGKSPLNTLTESSGTHGPTFDGNTVLFETMTPLLYVFVGHYIKHFRAHDPIDYYTSPVVDPRTIHPVAIDTAARIYLLDEDVIVTAPGVPDSPAERDRIDFYSRYFGNTNTIKPCVGFHANTAEPAMYVVRYINGRRITDDEIQPVGRDDTFELALVVDGVEGGRIAVPLYGPDNPLSVVLYSNGRAIVWKWSPDDRTEEGYEPTLEIALVVDGVEGQRQPVSAAAVRRIESQFAERMGFHLLL